MHDRRIGSDQRPAVALANRIMAHITAGEVESSTGGILVSGSRSAVVSQISVDSRTLRPGDLFFAIRGPHNDGHGYVPAAFSKGACGAVVETKYEPPPDLPRDRILIRVENTHQALKDLATDVRRQWRGSLVAITGSVGKTTTKEFVAHVLQTEYSIYRSPGNYNNLFGLPLSIFGLSPDDHIGIFEMGMSARGEISEMCRIARPDVGIITNVAPVHLEFFRSLEEIALAKGELAEALEPDGTLVCNADDALVREIASRFSGHTISFGLNDGADVKAENVEIVSLYETRFQVVCSGITHKASIPMAGLHYVMNTLPAIAVGRHYRISLEQILESLREIRQAPMRGQVLRFSEGFTLIDDSYNSNPRALMQMLETLGQLRFAQRRVVVAGEMLELGPESPLLHYQCGVRAAKCRTDLLIAVQGDARELARGAVEGGMPLSQARFFDDAGSATEFILGQIRPGDFVLVKGSRGVHLETTVQAIQSRFQEESR